MRLVLRLVFLVLYRVSIDTPASWRRERPSAHATNLALAAILVALAAICGVWEIVLPIMVVASIVGVWLFAVQHKFDDALWARQDGWDTTSAALHGSSYLRLPRVLQWFTGNIGFHHLHHLAPRMPNYRLSACHRACPEISGQARKLSLWEALRAPGYALWDETRADGAVRGGGAVSPSPPPVPCRASAADCPAAPRKSGARRASPEV